VDFGAIDHAGAAGAAGAPSRPTGTSHGVGCASTALAKAPHCYRTCARSKLSGWRDGALYPLARGCRAPRLIMGNFTSDSRYCEILFDRIEAAAAPLAASLELGRFATRPIATALGRCCIGWRSAN